MNRQQSSKSVVKILTTTVVISASFSSYANQVCQTDNIRSTSPTSRYTIHTDGTVTDNSTDLMWQLCSASENGGQNKSQCNTPTEVTWGEALDYIPLFNLSEKFAGYTDWRLPNIRELTTLVQLQCFRPAINLSVFAQTPPSHYWSSSPYKFYPHYSWYVNFEDGVYSYGDRSDKKHIRLVRDAL